MRSMIPERRRRRQKVRKLPKEPIPIAVPVDAAS
jgi:ribosomal protein S6--L-glutamate ligase